VCADEEVCDLETGDCVPPECSTDDDCDDTDLCTVDRCEDGVCVNDPVECTDGESCDPETGTCVKSAPTTLLEADGIYTGAGSCSDDDNRVTLTSNGSTLTLSGFTGNGDITLTPTSDTTATASNVVAFGVPGHTLTLTLDLATGQISFVLTTAGTCSTTLQPL